MHDEDEGVVGDDFNMDDPEEITDLGGAEHFEDEEDSYDPEDRYH